MARHTTTQKGLGWKHQKQVAKLKDRHRPGTPCWWCGQAMHLSQGLQGDHSIARAHGGTVADRLMHGPCNTDRGAGDNDHLRPALRLRNGGHTANAMPWS